LENANFFKIGGEMNHFFRKITMWVGSTWGVFSGMGILLVWLVGGLFVGFSNGYQLVGNTCMSAISYALLFVIQNSINHDSIALHKKLDEIIRSLRHADNRMMAIENLSDEELNSLCSEKKKGDG
jgi:low affinity Fe/Cu permease